MIRPTDQSAVLGDEIVRLAGEVSELGILCMDAFKYAAECLFGADGDLAQFALEAASSSSHLAITVHQKTIAILARWSPSGTELQRIIGLQRMSTEYARIAANARHVAEQAVVLSLGAEQLMARISTQAPRLLVQLVHQVYIALRGCLVLMNTGDRGLARRILAEDAELERLYMAVTSMLTRAVGGQPTHVQAVQRLLVALSALRQIGMCTVAICEDWLN